MKVRLTGLKQQDRKISTIKILRRATGYGLRQSKDIVDGMINSHHNGATISLEIVINSAGLTPLAVTRDMNDLSDYFHFESEPFKQPIELKLWEVTCAAVPGPPRGSALAYVLASDAQKAIDTVAHTNGVNSPTGCTEIKGPFMNGQLLCIQNG